MKNGKELVYIKEISKKIFKLINYLFANKSPNYDRAKYYFINFNALN